MEHVVDVSQTMRQEPQSMVKPVVKARNCQVMLELVIAELRAGDYHSRMPDAAAKKRIENKYFELVGEKICWDPEITNKIGYLRKLWSINGQLIKRTGVAVDQSTGQIDMMQTWNMETKDKRLGSRQSIGQIKDLAPVEYSYELHALWQLKWTWQHEA
ncbi:hypothetical protein YC2023_016751 [Brassica napus]